MTTSISGLLHTHLHWQLCFRELKRTWLRASSFLEVPEKHNIISFLQGFYLQLLKSDASHPHSYCTSTAEWLSWPHQLMAAAVQVCSFTAQCQCETGAGTATARFRLQKGSDCNSVMRAVTHALILQKQLAYFLIVLPSEVKSQFCCFTQLRFPSNFSKPLAISLRKSPVNSPSLSSSKTWGAAPTRIQTFLHYVWLCSPLNFQAPWLFIPLKTKAPKRATSKTRNQQQEGPGSLSGVACSLCLIKE